MDLITVSWINATLLLIMHLTRAAIVGNEGGKLQLPGGLFCSLLYRISSCQTSVVWFGLVTWLELQGRIFHLDLIGLSIYEQTGDKLCSCNRK